MSNDVTEIAATDAARPIRGNEGAGIIGPTNPAREAESHSRLAPPSTDHGTLPNLK
jgi:oxalate decarboxylase